jgi:hypothetical protein
LAARDLLPGTHLFDSGYVDADESREMVGETVKVR